MRRFDLSFVSGSLSFFLCVCVSVCFFSLSHFLSLFLSLSLSFCLSLSLSLVLFLSLCLSLSLSISLALSLSLALALLRSLFLSHFAGAEQDDLPSRKPDVKLPEKWNSNSHGARPVHQITMVIKWIRTGRLSMNDSFFDLWEGEGAW